MAGSSEIPVHFYKAVGHHIANKSSVHSHCHENIQSCSKYLVELFVLMIWNVNIMSSGCFIQTTFIFCSFGMVVQIFSEEFQLTCCRYCYWHVNWNKPFFFCFISFIVCKNCNSFSQLKLLEVLTLWKLKKWN